MIREEIIRKYVIDKDVLDVGAVGQTEHYNLWDEIKDISGKITGIDIVPSNNENIVEGNMENYSFDKQFDVIILGDIIEHVGNQGLLLDNIRKHLKPDGVFILTTPNAKWPTVFLPTNVTHTLWHDRSTLEVILKRYGFIIKKFLYYYGNKKHYNFFQRILTLRQAMLVVCGISKDGNT